MSFSPNTKPAAILVVKRQLAVCTAFALLLGIIVASLSIQDRRREWTLRVEQAKHRLDIACELLSRGLDSVRADALFLAGQEPLRLFVQGDESQLEGLKTEYMNFVHRKQVYDQIRVLDLNGRETIRVNYDTREGGISVPPRDLQDKSDRYYFQQALSLRPGEVFVSDFDLNLEHGQLERPLKPVIRFVTPVVDRGRNIKGFLVLNYLGARLLRELDQSTIPGATILLRPDGHYLRSVDPNDSWGWLLGHQRTFARQFPVEWSRIDEFDQCEVTSRGAFAARRVALGNPTAKTVNQRDSILVVSYLPRDLVFANSDGLLLSLLMFAGGVFFPLAIFARYWANAMVTRQLQNDQIALSEERLRELSARLLRIQEDERRAISREIHDDLGQQATAINLDLRLARRKINTAQAEPHLERAIRENEQLLQTLHAFASRVRPAVLDDLGLRDALESQVWEFQERTHIQVNADLSFASAEIPNEIADHAYRLVQESLNNVAKHADASTVDLSVSVEQSDSSRQLCIAIRDDGRGYDAIEHNGQRLGLVGMQERVDLMAGELQIKSSLDGGTDIQIRLPFPDSVADQTKVGDDA